jgi:hypothetical protein
MWAPAFLFLFLLPLPFFSPGAITQMPPAPCPIPLCPDDVQPAPSPTLWPRAPPSHLYPELAPMHCPVIRRALLELRSTLTSNSDRYHLRSSASTSPVEPQASCPCSSSLEHLPTCLRKTKWVGSVSPFWRKQVNPHIKGIFPTRMNSTLNLNPN